MPRNNKQQNNLTRAQFYEESDSPAQNAQQIQNIPTTDANRTPESTPNKSPEIYGDAFNFALSESFTKKSIASLTTKDAILKVVRDCVLTNNEERCERISPYIHSFWRNMHVKLVCLCIDYWIAISRAIIDAYIDAIHSTHAESWRLTSMVIDAWWPYMDREVLKKSQIAHSA